MTLETREHDADEITSFWHSPGSVTHDRFSLVPS
jgi:hypothetical protein